MEPALAIVPSAAFPTAYDVLDRMAASTDSLRGAVAFVTSSGVERMSVLLTERTPLDLEVIARGAPITQPAALEQLAGLGAKISIVVGQRAQNFHPKLWLAKAPDKLHVLAGSGNLTAGGLGTNDEQFEYLQLAAENHALVDQHEARFLAFADLAVPLADIQGTQYWTEWQRQVEERELLTAEERKLDRQLANAADISSILDRLYADLVALYEETKATVRIAAPGGGDRPYIASRFKQSIDRGYRQGLLPPAVARIVREPTEGFNHLAEANRPDLMVETLVLDTTKPYHHLFTETTKENARATMDDFYKNHPVAG